MVGRTHVPKWQGRVKQESYAQKMARWTGWINEYLTARAE
jgi:hypothetical protein